MSVSIKAYAKLNLTLGITGREKGYHLLDSLVCSVDIYDLIKLTKRKDDLVSVEMHGMGSENIEFENNNAVRAAESFIKNFKTRGADIKIFKNIPLGAGLGGSSADAAGVLLGMAKLYGTGSARQLKEIADGLGSDTGYMLSGGFARLEGRGERINPLDCGEKLNFLLLVSREGVSTAKCYSLYDEAPVVFNNGDNALNALLSGDKISLGKNLFNALYASACALNADVKTAFEELSAFSPLGVNMTGSGSGVYALFENSEFCTWAQSRYRGKFKTYCLKTR